MVKSDGRVVPCVGARVYLLLRPIDMESVKKKATVTSGEFNPRLAHLYVDYVISSPDTQQKLAYAKASTDPQGNFAFPNLPPDRWYYVTAQALTDQVMVSWQVGVFLHVGERVQVVLTNANAVLPIYAEPKEKTES